MSNLGDVLRKLVYSNVSQTGVWGRSPQPLDDFCKIWKKCLLWKKIVLENEKNCFGEFLKKNVCFGKTFVKNVCKNGIKIVFFYPWATPLASSIILK